MQSSVTKWRPGVARRLIVRLLAIGGMLASSQLAACVGMSGIDPSGVQYQGANGPSIGGNYNPALGGPTRGGASGGT